MKPFLKRLLCICLCIFPALSVCVGAETVSQVNANVEAQIVNAPSAILMEQTSGQILYQHNPDQKLPIASVTKTMTMLLIMEAIDSGKIKLNDIVTVSEYAASMGGSQVFLESGEQMTVNDMLKAIVVASGNDAAVAMAEHISGTETAFVEMMNKRAAELGCKNSHFINCNGLDETADHYSTARDIALISSELLKHPKITDYTTIWMDTLRNGDFGLSNTNKLIRFYSGANGIKTGSTSIAKYCISASAKRNNMQLIAVILAAPTTSDRFASATRLLDYGFANYTVVNAAEKAGTLEPLAVMNGKKKTVSTAIDPNANFIVKKGNNEKISVTITAEHPVQAPVKPGQVLGKATYIIEGEKIAEYNIVANSEVEKMTIVSMFANLINIWLCTNQVDI